MALLFGTWFPQRVMQYAAERPIPQENSIDGRRDLRKHLAPDQRRPT